MAGWFWDFVMNRSGASAGAPGLVFPQGGQGPQQQMTIAKAMNESLNSFSERFRSRNVDTYDPNVTTETAYTDEHYGAAGLTVEQVRAISYLRPISMFMSLFATQFARHGKRATSRNDIGAVVGLKDPNKSMSKAAQKVADEIWTMLDRGVSMRRKMHMLGRDSAALDLGVGEITWSKGRNGRGGNRPYGWMAYDAASYRLATLSGEEAASGRAPLYRPVLQYEHAIPVNAFAPEEILWVVRRPRTDRHVQGWGFPEIVEAAETMATLIKAHAFNDNFFENGTHAKYFLKFKMSMTPEQWESFKRQFQEQLKGLDNAHKIGTILLSPGVQGISQAEDVVKETLSESPKDMEFRWGFGFYYRELAAICGVDLDEVGMGDPADTGRSTLQERDTGAKVLMSRERRLEPALDAFADELNIKLIDPFDEDFCIRFQGLSTISPKEQAELDKTELESFMTWNEVRARRDLPKVKAKWADECPFNAVAFQLYKDQLDREQAEKQRAQQAQTQAEQGAPGDGEGGDDGAPGASADGGDLPDLGDAGFDFGFGGEEAAA